MTIYQIDDEMYIILIKYFNSSIDNLKEQILNQTIVSCNEISWSILGLSAATLNTFLLFLFLLINTIFIFKKYNNNKNNV